MARANALTGIRAFAALAIVFQHYQVTPMLLPFYCPYGALGVDMFFILSGFIIAHVHTAEFAAPSSRRCLEFYGLRFARIYPMHLLSLLALLALALLAILLRKYSVAKLSARGPSLLVNLMLLQAWWRQELSWNYPAWSISCEWFAYLLFPFFAWGLVRLRGAWPALAAAAIVALFFWAHDAVFHGSLGAWSSGAPALLRVALEFALGAVLWWMVSGGAAGRSLSGRWAALAALLLAGLSVDLYGRADFEPVVVMSFAATIVAASRDDNWLSWSLRRPVFVYLGEISYSIFMLHVVVQTLNDPIKSQLPHWPLSYRVALGVLQLLATIGLAAACYRWVEIPARRWCRGLLRHPPTPLMPLPSGRPTLPA